MVPDDTVCVEQIERESFSTPWTEKMFLAALKAGNHLLRIICEPDGTLAGYYVLYIAADEADLADIAVRQQSRRRGYAGKMLRDMKDQAVKCGVVHIFLEVRESNLAAQSAYLSAGFTVCGRRKRYYHQPEEDALIMMCDLDSPGAAENQE